MAGAVILPKHVEMNKGKGVYCQQRGENHSRLVLSSWLLSLHLRLTYASLLCRSECVRNTNLLHRALSLLTCWCNCWLRAG
jgi:hypothetical protein